MISVILPVYNQEKTIEAVINKVSNLSVEKEIIVVNDCSKDNTELILRGLSLNSLKVIHHVSNRGKAAAVRTGLQNATGEFILIQNGDLRYDPGNYLKLLGAIKDSGADIVLGARFSKMHQGTSGLAKVKNYFSTLILNILFGVKLYDWFTHCQLMRRESFLNLAPELKGADTAFEILTKALRKKMRVMEVPIFYPPSQMNAKKELLRGMSLDGQAIIRQGVNLGTTGLPVGCSMIKRILVIRNDRFGEFLLNIPAIRALKERYPQAELTLAVNSTVSELATAVECVDQVVVWDQIRKGLRKHRFDLCVVLNPTKEAHQSIFLAGIPVRVGYDRKWGFLLTHKLKDTKHQGSRHEVDCNLELVGLLGAKTQDLSLAIKVNDNLYKYFINQKIVIIHPFTSDPVKQWPIERFGELAQRIIQEMKVKVVLVGRVEDRGQSPLGTVPLGTIDLINKTSLVELAALLKRGSLVVSGDSGPMHLAASVGTPVIALFRNDLPGKTAQRWGPWGEGHIVIEKSNLEDISVEEVLCRIKERII
ncbi:MAG: glycosyltransferase family 9 protein [Candidatus Omnitrophota bacterium]|nr:glycosyltransferase family 9 protein [Candidatus Omnitrophota bacterium]